MDAEVHLHLRLSVLAILTTAIATQIVTIWQRIFVEWL